MDFGRFFEPHRDHALGGYGTPRAHTNRSNAKDYGKFNRQKSDDAPNKGPHIMRFTRTPHGVKMHYKIHVGTKTWMPRDGLGIAMLLSKPKGRPRPRAPMINKADFMNALSRTMQVVEKLMEVPGYNIPERTRNEWLAHIHEIEASYEDPKQLTFTFPAQNKKGNEAKIVANSRPRTAPVLDPLIEPVTHSGFTHREKKKALQNKVCIFDADAYIYEKHAGLIGYIGDA